jgi:hypothetical protein
MNDVGMAKGGGNAEFGCKTFSVFLESLLRTTSKFFDGVELFDGCIGRIGFVM